MPSATASEAKLIACRLGSARRRIRALLSQIAVLEGSDFPHRDGEMALIEIKKHFETLLRDLSGAEHFSLKLVQDLCLKTSVEVELHLPVLGFILRSTNVRNAFETYDPLKEIVNSSIKRDTHLIVSSEWDFVPFTYPMTLDVLPNHVLVGGPAHESESALLIPIAGHEIGHSAWKAHDVVSDIEPKYTQKIEDFVNADDELRDELTGYYGPAFAGFLRDIGIKRVEELFCDAFALHLFGDSYFYAFEHLTYPGGEPRGPDYPRVEDRVAFLLFAAKHGHLPLSEDLATGWRASSDDPMADGDIDDVLDRAAESIYTEIAHAAATIIQRSSVSTPNEGKIAEVITAFQRGVPVAEQTELCDVVCAGWRLIRSADEAGDADRWRLINELVLKSIEVGEFERRTLDAQRP